MVHKVFVDTDVVISSIISSTGAAFHLLNQTHNLKLFLSNISVIEAEKVAERLGLSNEKLKNLSKQRFSIIKLEENLEEIRNLFTGYVLDIDDAHIIAGAKKAESQFLISYNTKHFKADQIKTDFNIILSTPANFLQYLRSL